MKDTSYASFEVGQPFPLPIREKGDGALFQVDGSGIMFLLKLSRTDVIAHEAFRTGEMELAFYEEAGILFLLYRIDGIFKDGWGDAPLSLTTLKEEHLPTEKSMKDKTIHLYLVDSNLEILLAQRDVTLSDETHALLSRYALEDVGAPATEAEFCQRVNAIWSKKTSAIMREEATCALHIPLALSPVKKKN